MLIVIPGSVASQAYKIRHRRSNRESNLLTFICSREGNGSGMRTAASGDLHLCAFHLKKICYSDERTEVLILSLHRIVLRDNSMQHATLYRVMVNHCRVFETIYYLCPPMISTRRR
jgi:hypothetical protein